MVLDLKKQPLITVTAKAAENILYLMAEQELDFHYLRLFGEGSGCSDFKYGMAFTREPRYGDTIVFSSGIRILVDTYSLILLQGMTIDFVETSEGFTFSIDNPSETPGSECISCSGNCNSAAIFEQKIPIEKLDFPNTKTRWEQVVQSKDMLNISTQFQSRTIMFNRLLG